MAQINLGSNYKRYFILVRSADHISKLEGASPEVSLSKAGAAFATAAGSVAGVGLGHYYVDLTSVDTNTVGDLAYHISATSADDTDFIDQIIAGVTIATLSSAVYGPLVNTIWATPSRTLSSFGTLQGDIVNNVWATASRTITGTGTDAIAAASIAAAAGSKIADIVLRRTAANARASGDGDAVVFRSLLGATSKLVNKVAPNGATLEIMEENDTTVFGSQTMTTDSAAAPITALDTV